jgi:hypothetical protein
MGLRDFVITPREAGGPDEAARPREAAPHEAAASRDEAARSRLRFARPRRLREASAAVGLAPSLGVLATARDLPAVAVAAGFVVARRSPAALVCLHAPGDEVPAPALRAPTRAAAARLATSLRARGLAADARGRVALVELAREDEDPAGAAARALAAAGPLPNVLALAARDPDLDVLLAAQDAVLVVLPPSADPPLVELAVSSAARIAPRATSIALNLDPASRALALAGLRAPAVVRAAVEGVIA